MAPSTGSTGKSLFVSNQEHCFPLEKLHPTWRNFSCSWRRLAGVGCVGNSPGSREWELKWGKTGRLASGLGTATHHLAVAGSEALLCRAGGLCGSPASICLQGQWLSTMITLVNQEWGCPSFTVWHCRVTPRPYPIPEQPNELCPNHILNGTLAPGKDPSSCPSRAAADSMAG